MFYPSYERFDSLHCFVGHESPRLEGCFNREPTMSAKSLGTFPVICAIDEVQNPLPLKTMLFEKHMTSIIGISDTFTNS